MVQYQQLAAKQNQLQSAVKKAVIASLLPSNNAQMIEQPF